MNLTRIAIGIAVISLALAIAGAREASAQCGFFGVTPVAFGTYNPQSGTAKTANGSVTYACLVAIIVTIDLSTGTSNSYTNRTLRSGGNSINYNLYYDAGLTMIWGNGSPGTVRYGPVLGVLNNLTLTIYGRIPALQDAAVGTYSDTVTITINF